MLVSKNSIQKGGGISTYGLLNSSMWHHFMLISYESGKMMYFVHGQAKYFLAVNSKDWPMDYISVTFKASSR